MRASGQARQLVITPSTCALHVAAWGRWRCTYGSFTRQTGRSQVPRKGSAYSGLTSYLPTVRATYCLVRATY